MLINHHFLSSAVQLLRKVVASKRLLNQRQVQGVKRSPVHIIFRVTSVPPKLNAQRVVLINPWSDDHLIVHCSSAVHLSSHFHHRRHTICPTVRSRRIRNSFTDTSLMLALKKCFARDWRIPCTTSMA